tara:strand:- start:513 stop:995 length:483 start_codon:yes stop_codon:yes gene_type:complete
MEILKKIIIILLSTLYLTSCGFTPIYSKKNLDFQINNIQFEGDREIKAILLSNLSAYKTKEKDKYNYDLNIKSEKKVEIASKNTKGEATVYKININSIVEVFLDDKLLLTKHYNNSSIYSSEKKIIKMKEVESRNLSNLSSKLASEIILTLSLANTKSDF